MGQSLTDRYGDQIAGMLSCYDRLMITGTVPVICYASGMTQFLHTSGIRIFDYPAFAQTLRDRVRENAASIAAEAGMKIEHIAKASVRKEDVVARVLELRGDHPGLVHIISAMETCSCYRPWRDAATGKVFVRPPAFAGAGSHRKMPALLFLLPGSGVRAGASPRAHLCAVSAAILLQRPQLAGPSADRRGHRLHHGR
jgi:hypothetical protein